MEVRCCDEVELKWEGDFNRVDWHAFIEYLQALGRTRRRKRDYAWALINFASCRRTFWLGIVCEDEQQGKSMPKAWRRIDSFHGDRIAHFVKGFSSLPQHH